MRTNQELARQSLIKFIELLVWHRGYGSIRVLVETIQSDVFPRNEACFHKALYDDSEVAIRFRLHNDSNRSGA